MHYPYCTLVASIVYNGSFNSTASGPCSTAKMSASVLQVQEDLCILAEYAIAHQPNLMQQICNEGSSSNHNVEQFIHEFCVKMGIV